MKKENYFKRLRRLINRLPPDELEIILGFYMEMVEDKIESGVSEEQALEELGDVRVLARRILAENPNRRPVKWGLTAGIILGCLAAVSVVGLTAMIAVSVHDKASARVDVIDYGDYNDGWDADDYDYDEWNDADFTGDASAWQSVRDGMDEVFDSMSEMRGELETAKVPEGAVRESYSASGNGLSKISLDLESKYVIFTRGETDELKISYDTDDSQKYQFKNEKGTVSVENEDKRSQKKSQSIYDLFDRAKMEKRYYVLVMLPRQYQGTLEIDVERGWLRADALQGLGELKCDSTMSAIDFNDLHVKDFSFDSSMDAISIDSLNVKKLRIKSDMTTVAVKKGAVEERASLSTEMGMVFFDSLSSPDIQIDCDMGAVIGKIKGDSNDYQITRENSMGVCNIKPKDGGPKKLAITNSMGSVDIKFE